MQKAAAFTIPLAVGGGSGCGPGGSFEKMALAYDLLFYYWLPDATFNSLHPVKILFPPTNALEWAKLIATSTRASTDQEILSHVDLSKWAPEVETLLRNLQFSLEDVNYLLDQVASDDWPDALKAACTWLRSNTESWQGWIPVKSNCFPGQGLYSVAEKTFLQKREEDTECWPCSPGRYSALLRDEKGETSECRLCDPGYRQPSYSTGTCDPCLPGTFASNPGSTLLGCR